ncbi:MAG TPA: type II toxin-antitoxin system RelE/ParE family toxin, partial [Bryobacteraceae bacterium]
MTATFSRDAAETIAELPAVVARNAVAKIELLKNHPYMYPIRRVGIMRGYRYFAVFGYLFYYSVSST